jgi:glycerate dehydrogenase
MKIVILDGHGLNPSDLSWEPLEAFGDVTVYPRSNDSNWFERSQDAEIILTNKICFPKERIAQLPKLKYIGVTATGFNIIDLKAAKAKGIVVTNVPAYSTMSVAQLVFALLLEVVNQVGHHAACVRKSRWANSPDFCFWDFPLLELCGLTMGVVGFGEIGQAVARIAKAFGMKVVAHNRSDKSAQFPDIPFVSMKELLKTADVVSLNCPLTDETHHIINKQSLKLMKKSSVLINASRGPLVDELALAEALRKEDIYAAGLDVLNNEPPLESNPLTELDNCFITPHIAWATSASRKRCIETVIKNVEAFVKGEAVNVVN